MASQLLNELRHVTLKPIYVIRFLFCYRQPGDPMKLQFVNLVRNGSRFLAGSILGMLLLSGSVHAASIFHVTVNTASLISSSSAPFSLDFQFNNGTVLGNNAAVVSNFSYFGGAATGSPTLSGGATGTIASSVVFNNSSAFQELFQTFTPGSTLGFDVSLTTNVEGGTPDAFVFAILDKNLFNIPTTGLGDSLLLVNLNSATPTRQTFSGTGAFAGVTVATPEPASLLLLLAALPLIAFVALRKSYSA
jgi:hypothetical protein